jgi:hypothetical protein
MKKQMVVNVEEMAKGYEIMAEINLEEARAGESTFEDGYVSIVKTNVN